MEWIGMAASFSFVPIQDPQENLLLPWLDLYETAFPPNEKILVSTILKSLRNRQNRGTHMDAILNGNGLFIGMAMYELPSIHPVAVLWYIAVMPDQRSQGWGSKIYHGILSQINPDIYKALVFEVEIPSETGASTDAERRIRFYQKNGAKLLTGVHYLQSVGWHQPPTPMHIMVHPLQPLDAETAYELAYRIFGNAMQKTGTVALD
jgi:ribosomal protein S18 acetylase RimI-like enzyme